MKYFFDTEFLEGPQKESFPISLFRKNTPPTIDLISIGIVAEDGREYYAISKDFNLKEAWNRYDEVPNNEKGKELESKKIYWIRDNVLKPIFYELSGKDIHFHDLNTSFTYKQMKYLINKYGKTNKEIAKGIKTFCDSKYHIVKRLKSLDFTNEEIKPEFYAYYADYDWVVFCWLFGNMIDLPKEFPMYCKDLKQFFDEKQILINNENWEKGLMGGELVRINSLKYHPSYPKQENEHSAIDDARWNKKLFEFLNSI